MAILETRILDWPDEAACAETARALAQRPGIRRAFIELRGPLGAGKTTFVRHLLHALGVEGRIKSPTYAVMEPYELDAAGPDDAPSAAWHFDFYRFEDPREWEDAGFRDVFASEGLKLAEWPDKAEGLLPVADLRVTLEPASAGTAVSSGDEAEALQDDRRRVTFDACTALGQELLP